MTHDMPGTCGEHELLVGYLYDELEPDERARFTSHLDSCAECRTALEEMRGVRSQLATWTLPVNAGIGAGAAGLITKSDADPVLHHSRPWWAPGALAAAAVILLAVAAAVANLEITYGRDGISVRTGWSRQSAPQAAAARAASSTPSGGAAVAQGASAEDLAALEKRLRTEFRALAASDSAASRVVTSKGTQTGMSNAELLQRVQALIDQSETKQRRELALRVAQVIRDFDTQRQTDLVRIQQGLAQIEGNNAADRQLLNYVVRASQRQDR
jgi:hypothetical protein